MRFFKSIFCFSLMSNLATSGEVKIWKKVCPVKEALGISDKLKQGFDSVKQSGGCCSGLLWGRSWDPTFGRKEIKTLTATLQMLLLQRKQNYLFIFYLDLLSFPGRVFCSFYLNLLANMYGVKRYGRFFLLLSVIVAVTKFSLLLNYKGFKISV